MEHVFDLSGLTDRHRAIYFAGVRGADGESETPAEAPAAPAAPEAAPAEGATTDAPSGTETAAEGAPAPTAAEGADGGETAAEGAEETSEATLPEIPVVAEVLDGIDDADLRSTWEALDEAYNARRAALDAPGVVTTQAEVDILRGIRASQSRISEALAGRRAREGRQTEQVTEGLSALDEGGAPALPEPAPAFASASSVVAARGGAQPVVEQTPAGPARPRAAIVASAGTSVATAGAEIDFGTLGEMLDSAKSGPSGHTVVASVTGFAALRATAPDQIPELLQGSDYEANDRRIREAVEDFEYRRRNRIASALGQEAPPAPVRTAAICDPPDILRDIPDAFTDAEVVTPEFPSRPIGRLGFTFTPSITLAAVAAGATIWTETNQASVDPTNQSTWKPVYDLVCPAATVVKAEAVTASFRADNTTEMSVPERVENVTRALMAMKARNKEARVLARIDSLSGKYRFTGAYGALPTFAEAVNSLITQMAYADRIDEPAYTVFIPRAVSTLLGVDRVARAFGPDLQPVDVLTELRATLDGVVNVVEVLDAATTSAVSGVANTTAEPGYPLFRLQEPTDAVIDVPQLAGDYRVRIVDVRGAIYGESGDINAGTYRSPELIRQNKFLYFVEEYFLLAKHGPQHWATIDLHLCDNGSRAGSVTPWACTTAS